MKINLKKDNSVRRLVAVIGFQDGSLFVKGPDNETSVFIGSGGARVSNQTLEEIAKSRDRKPVYEGDTIEITF